MSEHMMKQALRAAAAEVIAEFSDGIPRDITIAESPEIKWQWDIIVTYGTFGEYVHIPSIPIREDYPHVPDHELLKAQIRAHLVAHPPVLTAWKKNQG